MKKYYKYILYPLLVVLVMVMSATDATAAREWSALQNRSSGIANAGEPHNYIRMPDVAAPSDALTDTPRSGWSFLYMNEDVLTFKDDNGNTSSITNQEGTLFLPIGAFTLGSTGIPITRDTAPGYGFADGQQYVEWADGETSPIQITFPVPASFLRRDSVDFEVFTTESSTSTPSQVDFDVRVNADATAIDSSSTNQTPAATAGGSTSSPDEVSLVVTADFASLTAANWVTLRLWRDDVATGTNSLRIHSVKFRFKRQ